VTLPPVQRIERLSLVLVVVAVLASLALRDLRVTLGVGIGGALGALNFLALRRILQGILRGDSSRKQAVLGALLTLKFGVLAGCIYLVVSRAPVRPGAFLVGFSVVVLAIFVEGFRTVLRDAGEPAPSE
jgi:hypothetical protein